MRENTPFPATVAEALPGPVSTVTPGMAAARGGQTAAVLPHRRANVEAQWRQARAWISLAYPRTNLDTAAAELGRRFPALAENIARLKQIADAEATHFEAEPGAGPDAFQAAVKAWEAGVLDGLAALATTKGEHHHG